MSAAGASAYSTMPDKRIIERISNTGHPMSAEKIVPEHSSRLAALSYLSRGKSGNESAVTPSFGAYMPK